MSLDERNMYYRYRKDLASQKSIFDYAVEEAIVEATEKVKTEGKAEGKAEELAEGLDAGRKVMAKN